MNETFLAIVNPAAGGGRCGKNAPKVIQRLKDAGLDIETAYTSRSGEAVELARQGQAKGFQKFVAVGGDGTGFEVINGLFPLPPDTEIPMLGFLPMGTGNSFLRDFSNEGAVHAEQALRDRRSRSCDVIRLTHDEGELFFINLLSFGFVADVCATRNARFAPWGEFGYVLSVFSEVTHLKPREFSMRIDDQDWKTFPATFLSMNNSRFTGGKMMMAPHADTGDGYVDLIEVGKMGRFSLLRAFPKIFKGTHTNLPQVNESKVRTLEFSMNESVAAMVDGEVLHLIPRKLDVLPGALKVSV